MADHWDEHLRCHHCRGTGVASLSQLKDARIPTVNFITAGFKAVQTEFGPDLHCIVCNVSAAP